MANVGKILINIAILWAGIVTVYVSVRYISSMSDSFDDLALITGMVESKTDTSFITSDKSDSAVLIKLYGDPQPYWASRSVYYIDHHLDIGDSVQLYIKKAFSKKWNAVVNEWSMHFSNQPREVFHLVKINSQTIIIDYSENQRSLRKMVWIFPLFALLLFGWFMYRWLGLKSAFILESGGVTTSTGV